MGYFGCLVAVHDSCFTYHGPPSPRGRHPLYLTLKQLPHEHRGVGYLPLAQGRWMYSAAPSTELDCDVGRQGEELPASDDGAPRAERIEVYPPAAIDRAI